MAKLIVYIQDHERKALGELAQRELRTPQAQVALILRNELGRLGMIPANSNIEASAVSQEGRNDNANPC